MISLTAGKKILITLFGMGLIANSASAAEETLFVGANVIPMDLSHIHI